MYGGNQVIPILLLRTTVIRFDSTHLVLQRKRTVLASEVGLILLRPSAMGWTIVVLCDVWERWRWWLILLVGHFPWYLLLFLWLLWKSSSGVAASFYCRLSFHVPPPPSLVLATSISIATSVTGSFLVETHRHVESSSSSSIVILLLLDPSSCLSRSFLVVDLPSKSVKSGERTSVHCFFFTLPLFTVLHTVLSQWIVEFLFASSCCCPDSFKQFHFVPSSVRPNIIITIYFMHGIQ